MAIGREIYRKGRLTARPNPDSRIEETNTGLSSLLLDSIKPVRLYVPSGYNPQKRAALTVMLHGAGGNAEHGLHLLQHYADAHNVIILAPASKDYSWDIIAQNSFGPDVILLDQALDYVFRHFFIDVNRIAIGGFSDGASYALSIGLGNGDLFTHIIAFSPGFYYTPVPTGTPSVFISHGTQDKVLPINPCSRRIVPELKKSGVAVTYYEFDGAHELPPFISKSAIDWFFQ